jgi:aminoglycoside phosphotransferase (APT) family kinase protein
LTPDERQHLGHQFALVLASFHACTVVDLPPPTPQATTAELCDQLVPRLDARQSEQVSRWCAWIDGVLAQPTEAVLLHGDFHGYNVITNDAQEVQVVLDLEEASYGDFHYDFRYLPAQEASLELFLTVAREYERLTGRPVDPARVMAWHVCTVLGDALWRTEAGVPLHGGGTTEVWIEELAERFRQLGMPTRISERPPPKQA